MINKNLLPDKLSGILELDSPAAKAIIQRDLGPLALKRLSASYIAAVNNGVLIESRFRRNPKVRFNPRPARIIHILLVEAKCKELEIIDSAVLASSQEAFYSVKNLACLTNLDFFTAPYLAALVLDELRHLHMSSEKDDPKFKDNLKALEGLYILDSFSFWPRLNSLISTALSRAVANCQ